jgi:hypothetical protein
MIRPMVKMWEDRSRRCVIGADSNADLYVVTVVERPDNRTLIEYFVGSPDEAFAVARGWAEDGLLVAG